MQAVIKTWQGGEHAFLLRIGEMRALEQARDTGIQVIYDRLLRGQSYADDSYHVIRLGLIGGGMRGDQAQNAVAQAFEEKGLLEFVVLAAQILTPCFNGEAGDPLGELAHPAPETAAGTGGTGG